MDSTKLELAETCPEHPEDLRGAPLGQYHCPACGCMCVAGVPHMPHDQGCTLGLEHPCPHNDVVEYCPQCQEAAS